MATRKTAVAVPAVPAQTVEKVLEERGNRYGHFVEHARITQNIKDAMKDSPNWDILPPHHKESLEMVAHKIGRMLNGDHTYADNFVDSSGYMELSRKIYAGENP